jgi:hypothetical protein
MSKTEVKIIKRNKSKPNNWNIKQTTVMEKWGFFVIQDTHQNGPVVEDRSNRTD